MNCAQFINQFLVRNKVEYLFGVPGYTNSLHFITTRKTSVRSVLAKHEGGAAWMAYGYARGSQKFGVCTATSGPGATNLATAVYAAYQNSVPIFVLTGQVERSNFGKRAFQAMTGMGHRSADIMAFMETITIWNKMLLSPSELPSFINEIQAALTQERSGPVHLNIPIDVLQSEVPGHLTTSPASCFTNPRTTHEDPMESVWKYQLHQLLQGVYAPLIVLGSGVRKNIQGCKDFICASQIPFCTTLQAKGVVTEFQTLDFGVIGICGSLRCRKYIETTCDFILAIGTSMNEFTTYKFAPWLCEGKILVTVNIDNEETFLPYEPRIKIISSCTRFFSWAETVFKDCFTSRRKSELLANLVKSTRQTSLVADSVDHAPLGLGVDPVQVIATIQNQLPENATILADSGNNAVWASHYLRVRHQQTFMIDINSGCMGSAVASAVGVSLAQPMLPVIVICGDGSFLMNGNEVTTAAELNLAIVWVVFNDKRLGMVYQGDQANYGEADAVDLPVGDIGKMSEAMGACSTEVTHIDALAVALRHFFKTRQTSVINVKVCPEVLPMVYDRAIVRHPALADR